MDSVFELLGHRQDLTMILLTGLLVASRVLPVVFLTPFLGGKLIPPETRMGISIGTAILVYPYATGFMDGPMSGNPLVYIVLMGKELFLGLTIGFVASELFYAMEIAGRALDVMRGSNMAEVMVPELGFRASPIGDWLLQLLLVIYIGVNGYQFFLWSFFESFRLIPIDQLPAMHGGFESLIDAIMKYSAGLFAIAFALIFPGAFVTFFTDVVFGMLNRVAPQMNAYFMAMAVKPMAAVIMLLFAMSLAMKEMTRHLRDSFLFMDDMLKIMS